MNSHFFSSSYLPNRHFLDSSFQSGTMQSISNTVLQEWPFILRELASVFTALFCVFNFLERRKNLDTKDRWTGRPSRCYLGARIAFCELGESRYACGSISPQILTVFPPSLWRQILFLHCFYENCHSWPLCPSSISYLEINLTWSCPVVMIQMAS